MKHSSLIIHIGDPKTGTSSIQRALQLGLVIGGTDRIAGFTNHLHSANAVNFARSFHPDARRHASVADVKTWVRATQGDVRIISSEFFATAEPELLRRYLYEAYPKFAQDIRVIGYVRPHVGRALSAFTERTKAGYTLADLDIWLQRFIRSRALYYTERFQKWRTAFGSNFILRPYIRSEMREGDVLVDFFSEVMGPGNFSIRRSVNENQKITLKALSGLRRFNANLSGAGIDVKRRIPMSLMISRYLEPRPDMAMPQLCAKSISRIAKACREDARRLDEAFFDKPLFQTELENEQRREGVPAMNLLSEQHFTQDELAEVDRLIAELTKRTDRDYKAWIGYYKRFSAAHNLNEVLQHEDGGIIQKHLYALAKLFS